MNRETQIVYEAFEDPSKLREALVGCDIPNVTLTEKEEGLADVIAYSFTTSVLEPKIPLFAQRMLVNSLGKVDWVCVARKLLINHEEN